MDLPRLLDKINVDASTGCWVWVAHKNKKGYGKFNFQGEARLAHRVSYMLLVGDIPDGLTLDHLCRNRACINPEHLEPVPGKVNTLRGEGTSAKNARKVYCKRGHKLQGKNLYIKRNGNRECRKCRNMTRIRWRNR